MEHIPIEIPRDNPGGGGPTTALCFDIGGSKYNVGLVDREGTALDHEIGLWSAVSQEGVLADLLACGDRVLERKPDAVPAVIGATIPGLADPERGMWVEASFSGIRDFPIAQRLTERYRLPAYVDNDGQACALAERMFGCCQGVDDFLYLTVSNGVGGACFLNGNLYGGSSGGAGEIGHCVVVPQGRLCGCGSRGCLERYAAGPGVSQNYLELGGAPLPDGSALSAKEIARRARAGEEKALETFRLEGQCLARAVAMAVNILNPAKVVLGGGISLAYDLFGPELEAEVGRRIYRRANPNLTICPTALGYDGGLRGTAAVALRASGKERQQYERIFRPVPEGAVRGGGRHRPGGVPEGCGSDCPGLPGGSADLCDG